MKYLSTLIFVVALIVSWRIIHEESAINFETHAAIQLKMVEVIKQSILEVKPLAQKIEVLSVSTEPLSDQALKTYFSYKFSEPDNESGELVEQQISGDAILRRKTGPSISDDHWILENVKTQTGNMTFKNGIVITPEDSKAPEGTKPSEDTKTLESPKAPEESQGESKDSAHHE